MNFPKACCQGIVNIGNWSPFLPEVLIIILVAAAAVDFQTRKPKGIKIERMLGVEHMTIGEGPHWDVTSQSLYWVDIRGPKIFKYHPATNKTISILTGSDPVGFIIPVKDNLDQFVLGEKLSITFINWDTTNNKIVSKRNLVTVPDPPTNRINDGKCDAEGRLWFGTMTDVTNDRGIEDNIGYFYSFSMKEGLRTQLANVTISNGITFPKDNKKMWYIDSPKETVDEYSFDIAEGRINYIRPAFEFVKHGIQGIPDGMTIDTNEDIWFAVFGSNQVLNVNPKTGELLQSVKFPFAHQITSCAFGGAKLEDLYVTSADENTTAQDKAKFPESGSIFRVTGLGVKGFPLYDFYMEETSGR